MKQSDIILTNHALDRVKERGLSQHMVFETMMNPYTVIDGKVPGSSEYQLRKGRSLITVIAKKNAHGQYIILSCWIDPPLHGTKDYFKRKDYLHYKKAGIWKRVWYGLKSIFSP